ncbi:MAG: hypothetical protein KDD47_14560, partial [Acidobacteria bacterium]|nr:hypothetical protein [Acidobacteriota bacterium]
MLTGLLAAFVGHGLWLACVAEDAYISFRFARNLASGLGLVWNPGEAPVEGFTNLLWVLLAALAERLHLDVPRTMQALGLLAGIGVLWLTDRFAARLLGLRGLPRLFPTLLLAASGPLAAWASSGLETVLFTLLALAALLRLETWQGFGERRDLWLGWLAVALAVLTRPEGGLLAAVALWPSLHRPELRKAGVRAVGAFALFGAALTLFRLAYFGAPVPNTFYAKTGGGEAQIVRGMIYVGFFAFHFLLPLLPWAFLGRGVQASREGISREGNGSSRAPGRPAVASLALWSCAYALYVAAVGGDYMAMDRFLVPILPMLYLLAGFAARSLGPASSPILRRWAAISALIAVAGTFVHSTPFEKDLFAKAPRQHGTFRGVETERWHVARLSLLAE